VLDHETSLRNSFTSVECIRWDWYNRISGKAYAPDLQSLRRRYSLQAGGEERIQPNGLVDAGLQLAELWQILMVQSTVLQVISIYLLLHVVKSLWINRQFKEKTSERSRSSVTSEWLALVIFHWSLESQTLLPQWLAEHPRISWVFLDPLLC
jgi:hypothetical protein